jgi:hypothetical protein
MDEQLLVGVDDLLHRRERVGAAAYAGGVIGRTDQDEVVAHPRLGVIASLAWTVMRSTPPWRNASTTTDLGPCDTTLTVWWVADSNREDTACHSPVSIIPPITAQRTTVGSIGAGSSRAAWLHAVSAIEKTTAGRPSSMSPAR